MPTAPPVGPPIVFIDIETTGLDSTRHEMWEIGMVRRQTGEAPDEKCWQLPVNLATADATALRMNGFWERYDPTDNGFGFDDDPGEECRLLREKAIELAKLTAGAWLVAANPTFDVGFIEAFLRRNGAAPSWHYRLVCVENLAAARLGIRPPWDPNQMSEQLGVPRPESTRHTALGDARWNAKIYDAVYAMPNQPVTPEAPARARGAAKGKKEEEKSPDPTAAEAEVEAEAPPVSDRPSTTEPSTCVDCDAEVDPEQAVLSYSRYRKVLCRSGDEGGCYARMKTPATATT